MRLHLTDQLIVGRRRERLTADVALDHSLGHDRLSLPLDPIARPTHPCASPAVLLSGAEFDRDEGDLSTPGPPGCSSTSCAASSAAPRTPARTPSPARRMLVRRPSPGTT